MCCLVTVLLLLGPRAAVLVWWLLDPTRWQSTFGSFIWPLLGLIFLPWATLAFVFFSPGGISGLELILIMAALVADVLSLAGGGFTNRKRIPGYND